MTEVKRYRKKPVEIEAMQWDGTRKGAEDIVEWVKSNGGEAICFGADLYEAFRALHIRTLNGVVDVTPHGYVIRGLAGEFYPHAPDPLWSQAYEPVD